MTPRARRALWDRSDGLCEVVEAGVRCLRPAAEAHHRVHRGAGGRHGEAKRQSDSLENLMAICSEHHFYFHNGGRLLR